MSLYTGVVDFEIIEQTAEVSNVISTSSFIQNGETWFVLDTFIQRDEVVYILSFHTPEIVWEAYLPGFLNVYESAETRTDNIFDDLLYQFKKPYADPENVFSVNIPLGWKVSEVEDFKDNVRVESVRSPDGKLRCRQQFTKQKGR